jgi:hypothetical protein
MWSETPTPHVVDRTCLLSGNGYIGATSLWTESTETVDTNKQSLWAHVRGANVAGDCCIPDGQEFVPCAKRPFHQSHYSVKPAESRRDSKHEPNEPRVGQGVLEDDPAQPGQGRGIREETLLQ